MPPPIPPSSAISRTPTTVKRLKWSGRRQSSAPFRALASAASRSSVVKSPVQSNGPKWTATARIDIACLPRQRPALEPRSSSAEVAEVVDGEVGRGHGKLVERFCFDPFQVLEGGEADGDVWDVVPLAELVGHEPFHPVQGALR